ncbi:hypothetical protein K0M31_003918 [Melipona bicolor]|uniref:Uncharacterized protein n=1 Tax=Melipona bicolor TaxID=60889 RepID=A0AA40FXT1_9HYME|nr:hypothetical protein K0M31_003918 [Melipona bicolor]
MDGQIEGFIALLDSSLLLSLYPVTDNGFCPINRQKRPWEDPGRICCGFRAQLARDVSPVASITPKPNARNPAPSPRRRLIKPGGFDSRVYSFAFGTSSANAEQACIDATSPPLPTAPL